jgi:hypothetical protein
VSRTTEVSGTAAAESVQPLAAALPRVVRLGAGVVLALAAVGAAVVECFYIPLHVGRWPMPVSVLAAVVGNVVLARAIAVLTGNRHLSLVPPALWLIVVLVLAAPRPEGDLIVPGDLTGLAFLFLGSLAGAFGAASVIMPRRAGPRR